MQLKEYSKSDKHIWIVQEEAERKKREDKLRQDALKDGEAKARQDAMRKESGLN